MATRKADKRAKDRPKKGELTRSASGKSCQVQEIEQDEEMSLPVAAMEYVWLYDHRRGISLRTLAERDGVSIERVQFGLDRAKALEIRCSGEEEPGNSGRRDEPEFALIPLFPIGSFTPQSSCAHREPIEKGSRFCCMVCHASGMDDHPGLRREPKPKQACGAAPDPMKGIAVTAVVSKADRAETRKQRRRRQFSTVAVA